MTARYIYRIIDNTWLEGRDVYGNLRVRERVPTHLRMPKLIPAKQALYEIESRKDDKGDKSIMRQFPQAADRVYAIRKALGCL